MVERTCTLPECTKPHRARGLCSTHYNQQHTTPEKRHPKQTVRCTWCGAECIKDVGRERKYKGLFCSLTCRDQWCETTGINPRAKSLAMAREALRVMDAIRAKQAKRTRALRRARRRLAEAAHGTQGGAWVSGACQRCGLQFIAKVTGHELNSPRYCSDRCGLRAGESRRRARERNADVEPYSRFAVFERDDWHCHLCGRPVERTAVVPHPLAPTIDHVIALARGGADTQDNVATAHFLCNAIKGDRPAVSVPRPRRDSRHGK